MPLISRFIFAADCRVIFSDGLGFVDFFPSDSCPVLYFTEAELLAPKSFRERVQLLSTVSYHYENPPPSQETDPLKEKVVI